MRFSITVMLLASLSGCGTTSVSPAISGNPGVKTAAGRDGYPIITSVTVTKPTPASAGTRASCARSQINDLEAAPTIDGNVVRASGKSSFQFESAGQILPFRFSVAVSGERDTSYVFDRIRYLKDAGQGGPAMASRWWSPENLVAELEDVAERIDECARAR